MLVSPRECIKIHGLSGSCHRYCTLFGGTFEERIFAPPKNLTFSLQNTSTHIALSDNEQYVTDSHPMSVIQTPNIVSERSLAESGHSG